jgi:hypothetical protein
MTSVYARLRLKKRTSINSISDFHKEKEMVDFRKCLMAFGAAALLFGLGSSAYAQGFSCTAFANPHIVRTEGVAELVGDVVLNCVGGTPTPAGTILGPFTLTGTQVQLNLLGTAYVTSRLTGQAGSADSEAVLSIDEPFPGTPPQTPFPSNATPATGAATTQLGCLADGQQACLSVVSLAPGFGASGNYNGTSAACIGGAGPDTYGGCGHPNIFQGQVSPIAPSTQINWFGVPIDAPGTTITRIIRITNVRANICSLTGGTTTLTPIAVTASIALNGSQPITVNNPVLTVAYAEQGLTSSVNPPVGAPTYQQCENLNFGILEALGATTSGETPIIFSASEAANNPAAFKPVSEYFTGLATPVQNVLGFTYYSESGWTPFDVSGFDQTGNGGTRAIGAADTGTEITYAFTGLPNGVTLFVPNGWGLLGPTGYTYGFADLVTSGAAIDFNASSAATGYTQITPVAGVASITYMIVSADPNVVEALDIPVYVAWQTLSATNPATGTASVTINFAPGSTAAGATSGPIPRFCQNYPALTAFSISPCTCNLLFPFVTNQAGFDTGIAIANTTASPAFGLVPALATQSGTISLWYYGTTAGNGPPPPMYTTQAAVPDGTELVFTLSSGGGNPGGSTAISVPATATFEGYIIAQANFQYCHGFAAITDTGAQRLGEGYLALSLDIPVVSTVGQTLNFFSGAITSNGPNGLNRTGQGGESLGH